MIDSLISPFFYVSCGAAAHAGGQPEGAVTVGAVIFSLPAALIGAAYYSITFGLGLFEAFSLYVVLGFGVMSIMMLFSSAIARLSKIDTNTH